MRGQLGEPILIDRARQEFFRATPGQALVLYEFQRSWWATRGANVVNDADRAKIIEQQAGNFTNPKRMPLLQAVRRDFPMPPTISSSPR